MAEVLVKDCSGWKGSTEPSFFQVEQAQLPQLFLVGEVLQPCDHPCAPLLDLFQELHITPALGALGRDTVPDGAL